MSESRAAGSSNSKHARSGSSTTGRLAVAPLGQARQRRPVHGIQHEIHGQSGNHQGNLRASPEPVRHAGNRSRPEHVEIVGGAARIVPELARQQPLVQAGQQVGGRVRAQMPPLLGEHPGLGREVVVGEGPGRQRQLVEECRQALGGELGRRAVEEGQELPVGHRVERTPGPLDRTLPGEIVRPPQRQVFQCVRWPRTCPEPPAGSRRAPTARCGPGAVGRSLRPGRGFRPPSEPSRNGGSGRTSAPGPTAISSSVQLSPGAPTDRAMPLNRRPEVAAKQIRRAMVMARRHLHFEDQRVFFRLMTCERREDIAFAMILTPLQVETCAEQERRT